MFFLTGALADSVLAATYFVDNIEGDDAHTLTQAQDPATPWKTLTHAAGQVPAGTVGEPNTIEVAAGHYSTGAGELFPITFDNAHVEVIGAGSSSTTLSPALDRGGASPRESILIVATAEGFAMSGFTFSDAADMIRLYAGGARIHDNVFAREDNGSVNNAIYIIVIDDEVTNDLEVGPVEIRRNLIRAEGRAIRLYYRFGLQGTNASLSIGGLIIEDNTFDLGASGRGVTIEGLDISNAQGSTIAIGNIDISDNHFMDGFIGVQTTGNITELTDTDVTAGFVTISRNEFLDTGYIPVELDYYNIEEWSGSSTGSFGGISLSDNTIDTAEGAGLIVDDIGKFNLISGTTTIDLGPVSVTGNTISASRFEGIRLEIRDGMSIRDASSLNLEDLTISRNTITAGDNTAGIRVVHSNMGNVVSGSSVVSLGRVDIVDNIIESAEHGVSVVRFSNGESLYSQSTYSSKPLRISGNTVTSHQGNGVLVSFGTLGYASGGESTGRIGEVFIDDNRITSNLESGLHLSLNRVASDNYESADIETGDISIGGSDPTDANIIIGTSEALRISLDESAAGNGGSSSASMGNIRIQHNHLTSDSGDGINGLITRSGDFAMDESFSSTPSILVSDNLIDAPLSGILFDEVPSGESFDQTTLRIGGLTMTRNVIGGDHPPQRGVVIRRAWTGDPSVSSSGLAQVFLGDTLVADNRITGATVEGIRVELERAGNNFQEDCRLDLGGIEIADNTVEGAPIGITASLSGTTSERVSVELGRIEIAANTISNVPPDGFGIDLQHEFRSEDTSTFSVVSTLVRGNVVSGLGHYGLRSSSSLLQIGGSLSVEPLQVDSNTISGWNVGIALTDAAGALISGNRVSANTTGILVEGDNQSVAIRRNSIHDNLVGGAVTTGSHWIDGENNWWGNASGPYDEVGTIEVPPETADPTQEKNSDGLGNPVSEGIDYCMWALAPWPISSVFADGFERGDLSHWDEQMP